MGQHRREEGDGCDVANWKHSGTYDRVVTESRRSAERPPLAGYGEVTEIRAIGVRDLDQVEPEDYPAAEGNRATANGKPPEGYASAYNERLAAASFDDSTRTMQSCKVSIADIGTPVLSADSDLVNVLKIEIPDEEGAPAID